jgi:hypothetical protein
MKRSTVVLILLVAWNIFAVAIPESQMSNMVFDKIM